MTRPLTKTEQAIKTLMLQNTGSHMLDSGSAYGYAYNERAKRDIAADPEGKIAISNDGNSDEPDISVEVTLSMFHFLVSALTVHDCNAAFWTWADLDENKYVSYVDEPYEWIAGLVDDDDGTCATYTKISEGNSYESDSFLDGNFQWVEIEFGSRIRELGLDSGDTLIFVQTHNGCDIRGGYSRFGIFTPNTDTWIQDFNKACVTCANGHAFDLNIGEETTFFGGPFPNPDEPLPQPSLLDSQTMSELVAVVLHDEDTVLFEPVIREDGKAGCQLCGAPLTVYHN